MSVGLIPRNRLKWIPEECRLAHSFCFFLHDECVRAFVEYEGAGAHLVTINFESQISEEEFSRLTNEDPFEALERTGYPEQARRVIINTIIMGMVSDCLHHIFEALQCFEKRKVVVGFNLLRKPLKQNLLYLAWMLGNEDGFYSEFMSGDPENLSQKKIGNLRQEIFTNAIAKMPKGLRLPFIPEIIEKLIYDRKFDRGFERAFEHAVHLITIERLELRTASQNFNFIFADPADDNNYVALYSWLPYLLFFLAHIILELFDRMRNMDRATKTALAVRSLFAFTLIQGGAKATLEEINRMLSGVACDHCKAPLKVTFHNAGRILLTDSFRCATCRRKNLLAFSWAF